MRCLHILVFFLMTTTAEASEPITVGVLHSEAYPYATMMKNSFEMALGIVNENGGIKGRPLKLVYANDQGKREPGVNAVKKFVKQTGVVMMVGAYQSSNTLYMARVADKLNTPLLVCTAADDRITQRKWRNVYRMNPPSSEYAKGLEEFLLKEISPKSLAIIYENSPYGTGGAMRMMWFCRENDIEINTILPYHKERAKTEAIGNAYFQRLIAPLRENPPDVIYMVSYLNDAAMLVKKIRELKINALLCGGAGGFTHRKFIERTRSAGDNLVTATLWTHQVQYPGTRGYYQQYMDTYSTPPDYHGAEAYAALLVVADVLQRTTSFRPESIREALDRTNLNTSFGPVTFSSYGKFERQNRVSTMVLQVLDGKFECVWPKTLANSRFAPPPNWRRLD